jgi:hypothetical protein
MPTRKAIIDELDFLSGLISERVRSAAAVILAFCWAFIVEGAGGDGGFLAAGAVMPPLLLAVASLVADFVQYLAGLRLNLRTLRRMEREGLDETGYDPRDSLYRLRQLMFHLKMVFLAASLAWLLVVIVLRLAGQN